MITKPERLYIDLLKKALAFTLWREPPEPIMYRNYEKPFLKRNSNKIISKILKSNGLQLCYTRDIEDENRRAEGKLFPQYAETMIGLKRLNNIEFCAEKVIKDGIEGDFIETGVWRGGACILMRGILAAYEVKNRKVFVADSFQGLPPPDSEKYPVDKGDTNYTLRYLAISEQEVRRNFEKYGLLDEQVVFLRGWFRDTLPTAPIEKLSIIRLDGDMYGSTMDALNNLYPKLVKGGFCIIDDYGGGEPCKKAVDDYRAAHEIISEIQEIDWSGRYWRK